MTVAFAESYGLIARAGAPERTAATNDFYTAGAARIGCGFV